MGSGCAQMPEGPAKGPFLLVLDFTDFFETVGYLPSDSTPKQSYYSEEGQLQKAYFQ